MTKKHQHPREIGARALCRLEGHPEDIKFEGKPMWQSYLPEVDAMFSALAEKGIHIVGPGEITMPSGDKYRSPGMVVTIES